MHVCLITCSYDTDFEPVETQLEQKLTQLRAAIEHFTLIIVNDASDREGFERAVHNVNAAEVILHDLSISSRGKWGMKGRALREGMKIAFEKAPDYLAYINLNLKVDAEQIRIGIEAIQAKGWQAATGSRDPQDSGQRKNAGILGEAKSLVFATYAKAMLPPLARFHDPNGPLKIFTPAAASLILEKARSDGGFFDCEWLIILTENELSVGSFPIIWQQRAGSRPPWSLVQQSLLEVLNTRRRWKRGLYR